ncbi:hypothetical protein K469DRAFT_707738 [Zopfia rhizophila CBS 207.26]|uniref:Zn(2)-C6 fungal-type domain-containing protein n=1 Tax=Zopfia rhizophila CBS 207.26 TaxID=1314779 RepID=A0A6A6E3A6_9PEZI|nr:hypothetical protein K469DRAFT_707738 [Zopfia rhizophila CBS 207.26]
MSNSSSAHSASSPSIATNRYACERCRFQKLRCTRKTAENAINTCDRCSRVGATCITKVRGRVGRPRAASRSHIRASSVQEQPQLDAGTCHDPNFDPDSELSLISLTPAPAILASVSSSNNESGATTASTAPSSPKNFPTSDLQNRSRSQVTAGSLEDAWRISEREDAAGCGIDDLALDMPMESGSRPSLPIYSEGHLEPQEAAENDIEHLLQPSDFCSDTFHLPFPSENHLDLDIELDPLSSGNSECKRSEDIGLQLCEVNQKLYKLFSRIGANKGTSIFSPAASSMITNDGATEGVQIGDILNASQEFARLLEHLLKGTAAQVEPNTPGVPSIPTQSSGLDRRQSVAASTESSAPDAAQILQISACYFYLVRIHIILFLRLLDILSTARSFSLPSMACPLPGLQIGSFPLQSSKLQTRVLVHVITYILEEVERLIGMPVEYSVCGRKDQNAESILGHIGDDTGFTDLFIASLRQEERSRRGSDSGGVKRLRDLVKSVGQKIGPGNRI